MQNLLLKVFVLLLLNSICRLNLVLHFSELLLPPVLHHLAPLPPLVLHLDQSRLLTLH